MENKDIIVWYSHGAASAVAAKITLEKFGNTNNVLIVNNPVVEEDKDNLRFGKDIENWLGVEIISAKNPKFEACSAEEVWNHRKFMSSPMGAPCTYELKKRARQHFEKQYPNAVHILGFTVDEISRHERFCLTEREIYPILINEGLTKQDCMDMLVEAGLVPPRMYALGYPNANCVGCVKASSPTYWNKVRETHPEVFNDRVIQSDRIGAKLVVVKKKRIPLSKLDPDVMGRPLKSLQIECGIFCEEQ
jgi:hypothetical protein